MVDQPKEPMIQMPASSLSLLTAKLIKANEIIKRLMNINLDEAIQLEIDLLNEKIKTEKLEQSLQQNFKDAVTFMARMKAVFPMEKPT